jgi:hypothetical protein
MPESDHESASGRHTAEQVEYHDRFAQNIPAYLSAEQTEARLRPGSSAG